MSDRVIRFRLNGRNTESRSGGATRLADVLRDELGLTGTKIGCNAGDCGICTVLIDARPVCACLTPVAQVSGRDVRTIEGLAADGVLDDLQQSFHLHGAAQCGICTPGMMMAAKALLERNPRPAEADVHAALGGVLCRCTGYRKIIDAVLAAAHPSPSPVLPLPGQAVGSRMPRVDGLARVTGSERYGADAIPRDALWLRVVRSPHPHARFRIGDLDAFMRRHPGLVRVLRAADVPFNGFGIYPDLKDQPVLAAEQVRFRGEGVLALVGSREAVAGIDEAAVPVAWDELEPITTLEQAMAPDAALVHADRPGNVLVSGRVRKGDTVRCFSDCAVVEEGMFRTRFVEHAYLEPEAGWARRVGDRLEVHVTTQSPYMDRDEVASVLRLSPAQVRIVPTACGGGFGGKLDQSVQPLIGLAAWLLGRPVACVYDRAESMASTTKRHPALIAARFGADREGLLQAVESHAIFNTGAYASWGPTVANRVPVHATGPYVVPSVDATGTAVYTHAMPAGAFRGFGVPQVALAHESLLDAIAGRLGIDRLEIRRRNAIRAGSVTATGQVLRASCGLPACLDVLSPHWQRALDDAAAFNADAGRVRRGVGIACMWYGIGNTSMSNPSEMRVGITAGGRVVLYNGCADIGQGSSTTMLQVCADGAGLPVDRFSYVMGDTDLTPDAGKSSASRQAFVSGRAAELAGRDLRDRILDVLGVETRRDEAAIRIEGGSLHAVIGDVRCRRSLEDLVPNERGHVLEGHGRFDPPTTPLDADGQGSPYATYGFGAQIVVVDVDLDLGTTRAVRVVAAHDVGRALNPREVEGQIEGGIAQGLGMALMEEYVPGRTENLHDYLIPTIGDVPPIEVLLVEDPEPLGPGGAKGVGEPALIPTPAATVAAIRHATGVQPLELPVTPPRLRALLRSRGTPT